MKRAAAWSILLLGGIYFILPLAGMVEFSLSMKRGVYSLEAYRVVLEEGLEKRFARHQRNHELLRDGLEALGFEFLVAKPYRLPMLNAVKIPDDVDDAVIRSRLLNEYNIEIGGGLGKFAGKLWRIGLMGESSTPNHVHMLLSALKDLM